MKIAILHYSVAPVVGGVEAVIQAHAQLLVGAGYAVKLVAGAGEQGAMPDGVELANIPEMDSRHPHVVETGHELEQGRVPAGFTALTEQLEASLASVLQGMDRIIVHNVFTKHFNLPLTAALINLLDKHLLTGCIAWCHDFSWSSPHSRTSMHDGYPWDLLRTYRQDVSYVTISQHRQAELAGLLGCPPERIRVIYDGIDPAEIYSLSEEGEALLARLELEQADLVLLMPVRITQAKNIEYAMQVTRCLKDNGIHPRLVITGPPDPHDPDNRAYYQDLLDLRKTLDVEQEVRFVYESGPDMASGYTIDLPVVRQIYRLCDALFMPSHREGFGMPILEAGAMGMPIFSTGIPAAEEIAAGESMRFSADDPAEKTAEMILSWAQNSPTQRLHKRTRQRFTWKAIFEQDIQPLLRGGDAG